MKYNPEKHHRRSVRLQNYDYSQEGLYFITVCMKNHICLFGEINNGEMILNELGKIAETEWLKTAELRKNVILHEFVVMPNHFHAILEITHKIETSRTVGAYCIRPENKCAENDMYNTFKNEDVYKEGVCNTPLRRSPSQTVGAIVRGFKAAVSKQFNYSPWQRNFYEHILRNLNEYTNISNYIINNPTN